MKPGKRPVTAFSYVRFSTPAQAEGDSLRRQTEQARAYCERMGWTLDTTLTLRDLGVSAFRGRNAAVGAFRVFLDAVKSGRVAPGSALIVESIDRISREGIDQGYDTVKGILKSGVLLVTLCPERLFDVSATKSLSKGALEIQLILERAAEESERKSERVRAAQAADLKRAREQGAPLARTLPAWIEVWDGKLHLIPDRAAALRKVCELAAGGLGVKRILRKLAEDNVPAFGRSGRWAHSYVTLLLRDRRLIGEHQPRHRDGTPDGAALPAYYPPAVPADLFFKARAGLSERHDKPGRLARTINIFAHLLKDARSGAGYLVRNHRVWTWDKASKKRCRPPGGRRHAVLEASRAREGAAASSFPFRVFEKAILTCLKEVPVSELLGQDSTPQAVTALEGQLAQLRAEREQVKADMLRRYSSVLAEVAAQLDERENALAAELLQLRAAQATPLAAAWADAKTLADLLDNAPDPDSLRLQLRTALRRIVERITILVVARGTDRLARVQIDFRGGARRDYYIQHHPTRSNGKACQPGWWRVASATLEDYAYGAADYPGDLTIKPFTALIDREGRFRGIDLGHYEVTADLEEMPAARLEALFKGCPKHSLT
jgi:DNA invertase Pin-like site-specific DNA recombinase